MESFIPAQTIFIHGLEGTSQGVKARLLKNLFPAILTPDFRGSIDTRMAALEQLLAAHQTWTLIGSSLGGLMAALFTCRHPEKVRKQVLLAPALVLPEFSGTLPMPVTTPTTIYHGTLDSIVPLEPVRRIAEQTFSCLVFYEVEDDHGLYQTVHRMNWPETLA